MGDDTPNLWLCHLPLSMQEYITCVQRNAGKEWLSLFKLQLLMTVYLDILKVPAGWGLHCKYRAWGEDIFLKKKTSKTSFSCTPLTHPSNTPAEVWLAHSRKISSLVIPDQNSREPDLVGGSGLEASWDHPKPKTITINYSGTDFLLPFSSQPLFLYFLSWQALIKEFVLWLREYSLSRWVSLVAAWDVGIERGFNWKKF